MKPPTERNCFVAGTEILTTEGIKNIEDIQEGDWVIADDPTTPGEIEAKQVLETFVRHTDKLVDLYIDGEVISTTGEHPFWTPDKGWLEAKDLHVGSLLQTQEGRVVNVDKIEKREGDFTVYNFNVESFHTYFVSELGILVHNADYNQYEDITKGSSVPNRKVNLTRAEFEQNLSSQGYTKIQSKDGKVTIFQNGNGDKYTLRNTAKSTGEPTVEYFGNDKMKVKIRLNP